MKHIQSLSTVGTVYSGQVENLEILETTEITEKQLRRELQILPITRKTNTKVNLIKFEKKKLKNKDFPWYPGFRFEPCAQKQKLLNHGNSTKQPQY